MTLGSRRSWIARACVVASSCLGWPGPVLAQTEVPLEQMFSPWPASGVVPSGEFGVGRLCDLGGDGILDLVQQRGDRLAFVIGVDLFNAFVQVPDLNASPPSAQGVHVNSFDVLPVGFTTVRGDSIVVVGERGLQLFWYDASAGTISSELVDDDKWADARIVRCGDVIADDAFAPDLVGVAADETSVLLERGQNGVFLSESGFSVPHPVLDVVLLDFEDTTSTLEIAINSVHGVRVTDDGGVSITSRSGVVSQDSIAALRHHASTERPDELLWVTALPNGSQVVVVMSIDGAEPLLVLGGIEVFSATSADIDGDGYADACLTTDQNELWFLRNRRGDPQATESFEVSSEGLFKVVLGDGESPTPTQSTPALADFTVDGAIDLVIATEEPAGIDVLHGSLVGDMFTSELIGFLHGVTKYCPQGLTNGHWVLETTFDYPSRFSGTSYLELSLWDQPPGTPFTESLVVGLCTMASSGGPPYTVEMTIPQPPTVESYPTYSNIYYLMIREVEVHQQALVQVAPAIVCAFSEDELGVATVPAEDTWETPDLVNECFLQEVGGASPVGGFVYARRPFRFDTTQPPPHTGGVTCPPTEEQ